MEVLKFSGAEIASNFAKCENLSEVIGQLESQMSEQGRVICRVHVNGLPFTEEDEKRFGASGLSEIKDLEIEAEDIEHVVADSIQSLIGFVEGLKEECVKASEKIRESKSPKTENLVGDIFKNVQWLASALQVLRPQLDPVSPEFAEKWLTNETHMVHTARELASAVEGDDFVLLADVVEYELYNSLDKWRETLSQCPKPALT